MKKRMLATIVALITTASIIAGCAGSTGTTATAPAASTETEAATEEAATAEESTEAAEETATTAEGPHILGDGDLTFEIWFPMISAAAAYTDTIDGNVSYGKLEELFGVDLQFIEEPEANAREKFQILVTSDDLPDLISYTNYYAAGGDALVDDGIAVDLAEYLDYLPNYVKRMQADPAIARDCLTDTGKIYELFTIQNYTQPAFCGILIRGDWLEKAGLEEPKTVEELHNALVTFKEQFTGGEAPMQLYQDGFGYGGTFVGMFGVNADPTDSYNYWTIEDGEVKFSPYLDGFKKYVQTMHDWYAEGLIDPNYTSATEIWGNNELMNTTGVMNGIFTQAGKYYANAGYIDDPDGYFICANMVTEDGSPRKVGQYRPSPALKQGVIVSQDCENIEEVLTMVDYLYSDEGSILATYGVEGETWHYTDDGKIQADDIIIHNPNMNITGARHAYLCKNFGQYNIRGIEDDNLDEYQAVYLDKWVNSGFTNVLPIGYITMTSDEGTRYNTIMSDVNTYILEWVNRFITGVTPMDQWNEFISGFEKNMDVEGALQIMSDAYGRYADRPIDVIMNR